MSKRFFKVLHTSKKSKARVGEICTSHGVIKTPAFVPCATKGTLKAILPSLVSAIGTQVAFVNTYHLVTHPGTDVIEKAGGIHKYSKLNIPLMSDSGGFQVFSLANKNKVSSIKNKACVRGEEEPFVLKITDDGVKFRSTYDGVVIEFTPEKSIEYQKKIGADIVMAFDECLQPGADEKYAERSMGRTNEWLRRCIYCRSVDNSPSLLTELVNDRTTRTSSQRAHSNYPPQQNINCAHPNHLPQKKQYLYGIIQGGRFERLRKKSAEFVVSQDTPGVAIGGVAVGETKEEMRREVEWISPYLPKDRPVHLLGVGQFDDIADLVTHGIDTFDCVEPTRLARMGIIFQSSRILPQVSLPAFAKATAGKPASAALPLEVLRIGGRSGVGSPSTCATRDDPTNIDILKSVYKSDLSRVDENCSCDVCKNFSKSYLHHLFKQREILGYTLATYHNLSFMEQFFDTIRNLIIQDSL